MRIDLYAHYGLQLRHTYVYVTSSYDSNYTKERGHKSTADIHKLFTQVK